MGWFSDFLDDVVGLDPNGGGIYSVFDDALGIDPNGGGIFPLLNSLGIELSADDFYMKLNQSISEGLSYLIVYFTGVPVQVDIKLFKTPNPLSGNELISGTANNELYSGRLGNDFITLLSEMLVMTFCLEQTATMLLMVVREMMF